VATKYQITISLVLFTSLLHLPASKHPQVGKIIEQKSFPDRTIGRVRNVNPFPVYLI